MRSRPLGKTGLTVSELAIGTWGLSGDAYGPVAESERDKVIDRALSLGITLFETADVYGDGAMERCLGERLRETPALVVTKIGTNRHASPPRKQFDRAYLEEAFEKSRERLGKDVLDVVLLHNPAASTVTTGEATGALASLKAAGKLRAWGVSVGSVEVARAALAQGAEVLSLAHNVLFSTDLAELADEIHAANVGLLAHSVLAHGLLTGYWSLHKEFPPGDHRADRWTPDELRRRLGQQGPIRSIVGGEILTQRAASLRYVLANGLVSSVLLGAKSVVQLDQLVREAGRPPYLTKQHLESLEFRLKALGVKK
ncbi:MAG TPA: aldo/keto reductase [Polyangiaceae bacterium]|nr:aldo/keto reductase [Polyangiaceae bacterium]